MQKRLKVGAVGVVSIMLSMTGPVSCKQDDAPAEQVELVIGFRPTVVVDLALLRAIEDGRFRDAGIKVSLRRYGRADLLFAALKSEEIQGSAGVPLEPLLSMATRGDYPYRGYLVWYFDKDVPFDGFLVPKNSTISSLRELDGHTVGSHPSRQVTFFVSQMLPNAKIQQYNPATPLLGIESAEQAAAYVLEPALSQAVVTGRYRILGECSISREVFHGARIPAALSILSAKWIKDHPSEAAAFVRIARAAHRSELESRDTKANIALLTRRDYGGYSSEVASRVVEPASSLPEAIDHVRLEEFFDKLRKGNLLTGSIDFANLLYVPNPVD